LALLYIQTSPYFDNYLSSVDIIVEIRQER
jgi:hypothetical protein